MRKMADQERSDFYAALLWPLASFNRILRVMAKLFQVLLVANQT